MLSCVDAGFFSTTVLFAIEYLYREIPKQAHGLLFLKKMVKRGF